MSVHHLAADPSDKSLISFMIAQCHIPEDGINPLNAELNSIRHLLALVGARHIVHVSRVRVKHVILGFSHDVRSALFWDFTQRRVVIPYRCIWTAYRSELEP